MTKQVKPDPVTQPVRDNPREVPPGPFPTEATTLPPSQTGGITSEDDFNREVERRIAERQASSAGAPYAAGDVPITQEEYDQAMAIPMPTVIMGAVQTPPAGDILATSADRRMATSFAGTGREVWARVSKGMVTPTWTEENVPPEPQTYSDYVVHDGTTFDKEKNRMVPLVRTVLFTPDGKTFSTTSQGILDSLRMIMTMVGPGPWNPPLILSVQKVKTASGRKTFKLIGH